MPAPWVGFLCHVGHMSMIERTPICDVRMSESSREDGENGRQRNKEQNCPYNAELQLPLIKALPSQHECKL